MTKFLRLIFLLLFPIITNAQMPIPMATQPALTYIEPFDSIINWSNNFTSGLGANHFASVPIGGSNAIPDPTRITTSSTAFVTGSAGGLQKDTIDGKIMMLVTGTTNNTSSLAFDMFLDFSNINAGNLSFDWKCVYNGGTTSNRTGTLKVYGSIDGINFTELTAASITVTNYVNTSGTVTNVALPANFNNSPTARLRFYYYNSAGGTTGSRPLISLDNIKVTASGNPCAVPLASANNLVFGTSTATTIQGSFTSASPAPDEYLVIATANAALTSNPVDSFAYNIGDNVGDGVVIYRGANTNFIATNLNPQTAYTFFIFSVNIYCNGTIRYKTINPLTGIQSTPAGPPCLPPTSQPTNLSFSNVTTNSIDGSFSQGNGASGYLIVRSLNTTLSATPTNGTIYNSGDLLGTDTIVYSGGATNFSAQNLSHSTTYHFFIFAYDNYACSNGPAYLTTSPLQGSKSTNILLPCAAPNGIASDLILKADATTIKGFFTPYYDNADGYLVVMSNSNSLTALPQNNTDYSVGSSLGNGTIISKGGNYSFVANGLSTGNTYYFYVFSYNSVCTGGTKYKTDNFLSGNTSTTFNTPFHYYFGNLHAHSSYSDGNKDNTNLTPADDYDFAKNAMCMDFLGISEHNHYSSAHNPGMLLSKYQPGITQALNYTASNPGFLALYGMEWGTLTNGGHVVVYGIDSLIGWETINGSHNYNIFVPQNDYLSDSGLLRVVNNYASQNAFATLAHPSWTDFQNIVNIPYNQSADSAIVGIAVESGPAFSTNTSYTDPGSDMSYLDYYLQMLAKGYRVGPTIDHDNHNTTFGRTSQTRTAIIAPSISKSDFFQAMRSNHFYATQDCDTKADIEIYGKMMGTEMIHSFAPAIAISVKDSTQAALTPVIKLMYGSPGNNVTATLLKSVNASSLQFTDFSLQNDSSRYYYADIKIGNKRTITAPIWYTRIDTGMINSIHQFTSSQINNVIIKENPTHENLNFDIVASKDGFAKIAVYNITGQIIYTQNLRINQGVSPISIPTSNSAIGLYFLDVIINGQRITKKFSHF